MTASAIIFGLSITVVLNILIIVHQERQLKLKNKELDLKTQELYLLKHPKLKTLYITGVSYRTYDILEQVGGLPDGYSWTLDWDQKYIFSTTDQVYRFLERKQCLYTNEKSTKYKNTYFTLIGKFIEDNPIDLLKSVSDLQVEILTAKDRIDSLKNYQKE